MRVRAFLTSLSRWRWAVPLLVVAGFVFAFLSEKYPVINSYTQFVLVTVGINIILSTSLNLVNGYGRIFRWPCGVHEPWGLRLGRAHNRGSRMLHGHFSLPCCSGE